MIERTQTATLRWKLVLSVVILMLLAGIVGGIMGYELTASNNQVRSQTFSNEVVLSNQGLTFKNQQGAVIAKLDSNERGGFFIIYNGSQQPATSLGTSVGGGGLVGLTNGKGVGQILRLTGDESGATVLLVSPTGKRGLELFTSVEGGGVSVNAPTGDPAVTIETIDSGRKARGKIDVLESSSGKVLWTTSKDGN